MSSAGGGGAGGAGGAGGSVVGPVEWPTVTSEIPQDPAIEQAVAEFLPAPTWSALRRERR